MNVTDFGSVLPGTSAVTSVDCALVFGSSNDTAMLRVAQTDRLGVGMWQPSRGVLDPGFNATGTTSRSVGPAALSDEAYGVAVQADGKIVTAGPCDMGAATGVDFCVTRHTQGGVLDTSFNATGMITTAFGAAAANDTAYAVAVQADGKIVVAGYCSMGAPTGIDFCLARYTTGGALDTTFNATGKVTTAIGPAASQDTGDAIALQPDGKILVVGYCAMAGTGFDACLARYTSSGTLDTTFSSTGVAITAIGPGTSADLPTAVAMQSDGKIVTAVQCNMSGVAGAYDFCVVRYTSSGVLDTSFGSAGVARTPISTGLDDDLPRSIAVQADGKIVAAGYCWTGGSVSTDICLARFTAAGAVDPTFGAAGTVLTPVGLANDIAFSVGVQPDGKILASGACDMGAVTGTDSCVTRYSSGGSLDTTFSSTGKFVRALGAGAGGDSANAVALEPDGNVVVAGSCDTGAATGVDVCLSQFINGGTLPQYGGSNSWAGAGASLFGSCLSSVAGGVTAQWIPSAGCAPADGAAWNAIPVAAAKVAYTASGTTAAVANLRFGMRTATSQSPGAYIAPITFDVLAPNV